MSSQLAVLPLALLFILFSWILWLNALLLLLGGEYQYRLQTLGAFPRWSQARRWLMQALSIPFFFVWAALALFLAYAGSAAISLESVHGLRRHPLALLPILCACGFIWWTTPAEEPARPIIGEIPHHTAHMQLLRYVICRTTTRRLAVQAATVVFALLPVLVLRLRS